MADTAAVIKEQETVSSLQKDPKFKMLAIDQITQDLTLQIRLKVEKSTIDDYKTIIEAQGDMDPVTVFRYGDGPFLLSDGFQRLQAYKELGRKEVPSTILRGNRSDALRHALRTNCHHGLRVTNADKRHGAEMAVLDTTLAALPDVEIAKILGVSATLVGDARRGEKPKEKKERAASRKAKKSGGGGAALVPVSAHERRKAGDARPTKAMALKQIEQLVNDSIVDEEDVIGIFNGVKGRYYFLPVEGGDLKVTIVGRTGRAQVEDIKMIIKDVSFTDLKLKSEKFVISAEKV